jgi:hypothetical protein
MPSTRSFSDNNRIVEWSDEINQTDNQFGLLNQMGLFNEKGSTQDAIVFDKNVQTTTLIPQSNRGSKSSTYGKDRVRDTYTLTIPHFKHKDYLTAGDLAGWRADGSSDSAVTLASAKAEKITDLRLAADLTKEYMKVQAVKGITKDAEANTIADMYSEFGVTQKSIDFVLGTAGTNIDAKISELKRYLATNSKGAGITSGTSVMVDTSWFDKFVNHPNVKGAYQYYLNSGAQRLRDDLSTYQAWGVVDSFYHRGITFFTYNANFNLPDGTTEDAVATDSGYSIVQGGRDIYRGVNGPAYKLSGVNTVGRPMYAYEYNDGRDEAMEFEVEFSSLYFMARPLMSVKVTSSN